MSKWIRGRLARPMASKVFGVLLASLLLPLAPLLAQAQTTGGIADAFNSMAFGPGPEAPTRIVVVDFGNSSKYSTGMLGREFADALSLELMYTRSFEVVKRSELESIAVQSNITPPLNESAVLVLCSQLQCQFGVKGNIDSVKIEKTNSGTYAEVSVSALVLSKTLGAPITGAKVTQKSAPRIGYSGNTDVLVHEAVTLASYEVAQRIMNTRYPLYLVRNAMQSNELVLGGNMTGLQPGMELITLRNDTVTGRVKVKAISADQATVATVENRGIGRGDKAIPVFSFNAQTVSSKPANNRMIQKLGALAGLGALAAVIGGNMGGEKAINAPQAYPLANPSSGEPDGAIYVRMPSYTDQLVALVVYRDDNPGVPMKVIDPSDGYFLDKPGQLQPSGTAMDTTQYTFTISPSSGEVTSTSVITHEPDTNNWGSNDSPTPTKTEIMITTHYVPPTPGVAYGYKVVPITFGYDAYNLDKPADGTIHPQTYRLFFDLTKSGWSKRAVLIAQPQLKSPNPNEEPANGNYSCNIVPGATSYVLEISPDASFSPGRTLVCTNVVAGQTSAYAQVTYDDLARYPQFANATSVCWRMGARADGSALPVALGDDQNNSGWVFSSLRQHPIPAIPPAPGALRGRSGVVTPGAQLPQKFGRPSSSSGSRILRR